MGLLSETSQDFDPAVCTETTEELLHLLESRSMPPSDVLILDHLKTLLLLQDTERLQSALKMFPEHCAMPPRKYRSIHSRVSPERSVKRYSQDLEWNLQRKGLRVLLVAIKRCLIMYAKTYVPPNFWPLGYQFWGL